MPGSLEEGGIIDNPVNPENETTLDGQRVSEGEIFEISEWAIENGINRKTVSVLRKEELTSKDSLILLNETDIVELGLTMGQRKLLFAAISKLKQGLNNKSQESVNHNSASVSGTQNQRSEGQAERTLEEFTIDDVRRQASQLETTGKTLDALLNSAGDSHSLPVIPNVTKFRSTEMAASGNALDPNDPRLILTVKSNDKKTVHVTQFLTETSRRRRQGRKNDLVLCKLDGDDTLVMRQEDEHPYHGISISEWSAANCRLMAYLIRSGELAGDMIEYYLAYTTQIYVFVSKYEWNSILQFDHQYRERQAQHGFKWGSVTANMELQLLQQRKNRSFDGSHQHSATSKQQNLKQGRHVTPQLCKLFKARYGNCPFGENCKYTHDPSVVTQNVSSKNQ